MSTSLFTNPEQFGIASNTLLRLDGELSPDHAAYLDLADQSRHEWPNEGLAVIEDQGNALLYLIMADAPLLAQAPGLSEIIEVLACRADARYLAVIHPGKLDFYSLSLLVAQDPTPAIKSFPLADIHAFLTGSLQEQQQNNQQRADSKWLDDFLFKLLSDTASALAREAPKLTHSQILSLVGRALFTRFIIDRSILKENDRVQVSGDSSLESLGQLFDTPNRLAHLCAWLDKTFNGNLLEIIPKEGKYPESNEYLAFFNEHQKICRVLSDVLHSAHQGQRELNWQTIKFQHVPADMLSQVYEHFAHRFQSANAEKTSIYYTPRNIAQQLVNAAFAGSELQQKSQAHVLDPTVGAGVFLVLAYKKLVQERWRETGQQPQRAELRDILHTQLCGLDINSESLKFAALSLYLTALELDPRPSPITELKFKHLYGKVLRFVGNKEDEGLGSLHERWAKHIELKHRFDIVVGNPPWTKHKNQPKLIQRLSNIVKNCAEQTQQFTVDEISALRADSGKPDPVFAWRVLDWLKPNGMMALAMHAQHMLFERGDGFKLRQALLKCIELTGVLNGSALRQTKIWPNQTAPFCLWVARNRVPSKSSSFYYLNPYQESQLLAREQYRLDMKDATVVNQLLIADFAFSFKTLSKGDALVWQLMQKIKTKLHPEAKKISEYWNQLNLASGNGFKISPGKLDASELLNLPMLPAKDWKKFTSNGYEIITDTLPKFQYLSLDRVRNRNIYCAPLVIFKQCPEEKINRRGAWIVNQDLTYSQSFNGYSCGSSADGKLLALYLQLLSFTDLFWFYTLNTSPEFGAERELLHKDDIDEFPILPLENLSPQQNKEIEFLSAQLHAKKEPWDALNDWACKLYGLNKRDLQLMQDTLKINLPFSNNKKWAVAAPSDTAGIRFAKEIHTSMYPFANALNVPFSVSFIKSDANSNSTWSFIRIEFGRLAQPNSHDAPPVDWINAFSAADQFWASQVRLSDVTNKVIWIGLLAQNRFWTISKARVIAQEILEQELEKHAPVSLISKQYKH